MHHLASDYQQRGTDAAQTSELRLGRRVLSHLPKSEGNPFPVQILNRSITAEAAMVGIENQWGTMTLRQPFYR